MENTLTTLFMLALGFRWAVCAYIIVRVRLSKFEYRNYISWLAASMLLSEGLFVAGNLLLR